MQNVLWLCGNTLSLGKARRFWFSANVLFLKNIKIFLHLYQASLWLPVFLVTWQKHSKLQAELIIDVLILILRPSPKNQCSTTECFDTFTVLKSKPEKKNLTLYNIGPLIFNQNQPKCSILKANRISSGTWTYKKLSYRCKNLQCFCFWSEQNSMNFYCIVIEVKL